MKLTQKTVLDRSYWQEKGYQLPKYDVTKMIEKTKANPAWVHFGAGNLFRAFPAVMQQSLLNASDTDTGVIVAEAFDTDIIGSAYTPFDNLSVLVVLKSDATIEKQIVASVAEGLCCNEKFPADFDRLTQIFENPSLQMVSFTITEKGYTFTGDGTAVANVTKLLYSRFLKNKLPIALVSMDNCSHNGEKLFNGIEAVAKRFVDNKTAPAEFLEYIRNPKLVSFPWSMIDKITPRPDTKVLEMLQNDNLEDAKIIVTEKNTYTSIFVNAEEAQYLVVEDSFPNGRPPLEKSGVYFTDRDTVNRAEKMKVCTCLNPLHTALAIFGCLLSYESIHEEMNDNELVSLIKVLGYIEGMPVVVDPKIISPKDFLHEVLCVRLPNPFMPDTPQRIATDTSQKLPVRFGETIKAYIAREDLSLKSLHAIPLVFAGWCRYLLAVDDNANVFEPSSDPLLAEVSEHLSGIKLGDTGPFHTQLEPILRSEKIFGVNLYSVGLGEITENYFAQMVASKGAVRSSLTKFAKEHSDEISKW